MDAYIIPNVHKHITMAQRHECKFAEVGVRGEVLEGVQLYGLHGRLLWFAKEVEDREYLVRSKRGGKGEIG